MLRFFLAVFGLLLVIAPTHAQPNCGCGFVYDPWYKSCRVDIFRIGSCGVFQGGPTPSTPAPTPPAPTGRGSVGSFPPDSCGGYLVSDCTYSSFDKTVRFRVENTQGVIMNSGSGPRVDVALSASDGARCLSYSAKAALVANNPNGQYFWISVNDGFVGPQSTGGGPGTVLKSSSSFSDDGSFNNGICRKPARVRFTANLAFRPKGCGCSFAVPY